MDDNVTVRTGTCIVCHKSSTMTVRRVDYQRWQQGVLAHRAFPEMPAEQRELLISGTHPECFDALFPEDDTDG
jgi:hypothetical protein